ncbi:MAG: peptidylprolyl isomerase [Candidatus Limnocylindria bacterium]
MTTNKGAFTIELHGDAAPLATANFVSLARCGFYDGIRFHRVLAGFLAQAGDPNSDPDRPRSDPSLIGTGDAGYRFEIEPPADDLDYLQYSVSMANASAPGTNGSQFFVALDDLSGRLEREYTIFGQVVEGTDVVDTIGSVPVDGPAGLPLDPVIIESIAITAEPAASPSLGVTGRDFRFES